MNILFSCAGRRTYLLKYFKEQLNGNGLIIATDMQLSAPALSVADIKIKVPAVYSDDYIDIITQICETHKVDLLISLNDLELPILAEKEKMFEQIGTKILVSSSEVIDICFDKLKTSQFINSIGLNTPKTYISIEEAERDITEGNLTFPLVLKPRWGSGSIGIEFVEDFEELHLVYKLLKRKIKRSILSTASVGNDYILIQEKISGKEFGLDIMNNLEGKNIGISIKEKISMRAGETDKAITINNTEIFQIAKTLGNKLGHIGNLDCDILEMNGKYYVLELNPRFGGGFPFSYEAGVNFPKAIIEWTNGNDIEPQILSPQPNRCFAKCDYLVETIL